VFGTQAVAFRSDGRAIAFSSSSGNWIANADTSDRLIEFQNPPGTRTGWRLDVANGDEVENYDAAGRLLSIVSRTGLASTFLYADGTSGGPNGDLAIDGSGQPTIQWVPAGKLLRATDPYGRTLTFKYDLGSRVARVIDPAGGIFGFGYDNSGRLTAITWPDTKVRAYHYNEPANTSGVNLLFALTGITDENGARFATYKYDTQGRAFSSEHAGGALLTTVTYNADGSSTVSSLSGQHAPTVSRAPSQSLEIRPSPAPHALTTVLPLRRSMRTATSHPAPTGTAIARTMHSISRATSRPRASKA